MSYVSFLFFYFFFRHSTNLFVHQKMEIAPEMYATQERHRLNKELGLPDARVKQVPRQTGRTHTGTYFSP